MLLLARRALAQRAAGGLRFSGAYFETDYANYVAWRDWGHPGERVESFSMAALRAATALLLGEMAPHTMNAGQIYFPPERRTRKTFLTGKSISTGARGASFSRRPACGRRKRR